MATVQPARCGVDVAMSRREVYHLNRELLRERTRCKALEEELENPMNIHRWRKLEVRKYRVGQKKLYLSYNVI